MGFMGLGSIAESDNASDFASGMANKLAKLLEEECKKTTNEWNTPGYMNVALFFKEMIIPLDNYYYKDNDNLKNLAKMLKLKLKEVRNNFNPSCQEDIDDLIRNMEIFLKK